MNKRILIILALTTFIFTLTSCNEKYSLSNTVLSTLTYEEQTETDSKTGNKTYSSPLARKCINRLDLARQIFSKINKHRKENGLHELTWVDQIGVTVTVYSESSIIPNAINGWKSSPGHNANILDLLNDRGGAAAIGIKTYQSEYISKTYKTSIAGKIGLCPHYEIPLTKANGVDFLYTILVL